MSGRFYRRGDIFLLLSFSPLCSFVCLFLFLTIVDVGEIHRRGNVVYSHSPLSEPVLWLFAVGLQIHVGEIHREEMFF